MDRPVSAGSVRPLREIVNVALFLASDEVSYVSGATIVANSTMTAGPDIALEVLNHAS